MSAFQSFSDVLVSVKHRRPSSPWYWLATVKREQGKHCFYCGKDCGDAGTLDHLVPFAAGGLTLNANHVMACASCNASKADRDVILLGSIASPMDMPARRQNALARSLNHLTRPKVKKVELAFASVSARWQHPRFAAYAAVCADGGFIGMKGLHVPAEALGFLRARGFPITTVGNNKGRVASVPPEQFLDTVWSLIEMNALVHQIDIGAAYQSDSKLLAAGSTLGDWPIHVSSMQEVVRRAPYAIRKAPGFAYKRTVPLIAPA